LTNLTDISAAVDQLDPHQFVEFLDQLVRINTTVPPGQHYSDFIAIISPRLETLGFSLQVVTIPDEFVKQAYPTVEGPRVNLVAIKDFQESGGSAHPPALRNATCEFPRMTLEPQVPSQRVATPP
jgi:acetylornithine deacetylase/succinyl-diaminopimelate desuccinylase-like protein